MKKLIALIPGLALAACSSSPEATTAPDEGATSVVMRPAPGVDIDRSYAPGQVVDED